MKILVSYVIQDGKGHKDLSEILDIKISPFPYSSDPSMNNVMDWAQKKKLDLKKDEELIIINVLKF